MSRGWAVASLIVVFALFGTCTPAAERPQLAQGSTRDSWVDPLVDFVRPDAAPPPKPLVSQLLDELRENLAQEPSGRKKESGKTRSDDPNTGVPPAVVAAALRLPPHKRGRIGRLRIPAIDLDVAYANGIHNKVVKRGPGHWPGTPLPGGEGNAVLSGHRTTFTHPFLHLNRLKKGDKVHTSVGRSKPVVYRVRRTTIVPESEYVKFVLRKPKRDGARHITLFACHPKGSRQQRIVVRAVADPIKPQKSRKPARKRPRDEGREPPPIYVADHGDGVHS